MTASEESERDIIVDVRSFGELLQWFRRRSHLTQQKLANRLSVRRSTISDWENNQFAPKYRDHVAKLAEILNLSPIETNQFLQAALFHVSPPPPTFEPHNPYKGLSAFTQADHDEFFGREGLVKELIEVLQQITDDQTRVQLLAAIGPSGCGKTSAILAGLLPELKQGAIPGSEDWVYIEPFRPGRDPLSSLGEAIAPVVKREPDDIYRDLEASPQRFCLLVSSLIQQKKRPVVLVIDQFEELFGPDVKEGVRQQFIRLLVTICTEPECTMLVILALRADCYSSLTAYPELARIVIERQQLVLPLDQEREILRTIIEKPADLPNVKLTLERNLVDEILFDLHKQVGVLPLLQFTLDQLFQHRDHHTLTIQAYHDIGRVKGALAQYIERVYLSLPSQKHQQLTRFLFRRLLQIERQSAETLLITRRQATLEEFVLLDPQETQVLREVITIFVGKRLLVTNRSEDTSILEISHEAILQEWPRLGSWIEDAGEDIQFQQALDRVASEWEQSNKPGDRLYRGARLRTAQAWAKRNILNERESLFLKASVARQLRAFITMIVILLFVVTSSGLAAWLFVNRAHEPGYVTTTNEYATGSLRWAIGSAHPNDTITFAPEMAGQTIVLTNVDLHIFQQHLTIQGPTTGHITIRTIGASLIVDTTANVTISDLVFQGSNVKTQPSLIQNLGTLKISNIILTGNTSIGAQSFLTGGGISNNGTLTMTNSIISGNTSFSGGGGISNSATMTMTNSTVSGNTAFSAGGGIHNNNTGTLTMVNSIVSSNTASGDGSRGHGFADGGGIFNIGTITMMNSTISGNTASVSGNNTATGGGISNGGDGDGTLIMTNSTVSGNTVSSNGYGSGGGGIYSIGTIAMTNSTISGNTAAVNGDNSGGGGIANATVGAVQTAITFCTIVNNHVSIHNGFDIANIHLLGGLPVQVYVKASIVGGDDDQYNPIVGVIMSGGYNVIQHMSSQNFDASIVHAPDRSVDSLIGVLGSHPQLQKNGGMTQTYQLISGADNPAADEIPPGVCTDYAGRRVLTDQRGMPRPGKNKQSCDSGSYEAQVSGTLVKPLQ